MSQAGVRLLLISDEPGFLVNGRVVNHYHYFFILAGGNSAELTSDGRHAHASLINYGPYPIELICMSGGSRDSRVPQSGSEIILPYRKREIGITAGIRWRLSLV